jgi:flagellar P-ring protein precursor FlgI
MNTVKTKTLAALLIILVVSITAQATDVRIKDIARVQGYTDNQLMGLGLVIGLNGTGDGNQIRFTSQEIANLLNASGIRHNATDIRTRNIAAVLVTATLPPFSKPGSKIDINVAAMGDAKSLQGGTLLFTELKAPNGKVYATAQGPVLVGGFSAGGQGTSITQNVPTSGVIPTGAIVQREVATNLQGRSSLKLVLDQYDFTTASRMAAAVNKQFGSDLARSADGGTVEVVVPRAYAGNVIDFIAALEGIRVDTDERAKVVINERTGTVVIGAEVKISAVAIAHGNLTITVSTDYLVSQPRPFSEGGRTVVVPDQELDAQEENAQGSGDNLNNTLMVVPEATNIGDIVRALNALGVTPRDIISILKAMRAQGALKAEIEVL